MPAPPPDPAPQGRRASPRQGFTLLELMLAVSILAIIGVAITYTIEAAQDSWRKAHATAREFREARTAMEAISRNVARATLNHEWVAEDADAPLLTTPPQRWMARSSLHFVCGATRDLLPQAENPSGHAIFFQLPAGFSGARAVRDTQAATTDPVYDTLPDTLNAWGYYVVFGDDPRPMPDFVKTRPGSSFDSSKRQRFHLIEFRQPSHELTLFQMDAAGTVPLIDTFTSPDSLYAWFRQPIQRSANGQAGERRITSIAENILALIVTPLPPALDLDAHFRGEPAPGASREYFHDSRRFQWQPASPEAIATRHRLPSALRITVIAMDEARWDSFTPAETAQNGLALRDLVSGLFTDTGRYDSDLHTIESALDDRRIGYRILTNIIQLPDPP